MFKDWLAAKMKEHNLSQRELSRRIEMGQSYVSRVCRGAKPSVEFVHRVANLFGEPIETVMAIADYLPERDDSGELEALINSLSAEDRELVLSILRRLGGR